MPRHEGPSGRPPAGASRRAPIVVGYSPANMNFANVSMEKGFRSVFNTQMIKNDVVWSCLTACIGFAIFTKVKQHNLDVWVSSVVHLSISMACSIFICYLCLLHPKLYIAKRTQIIIMTRLHRCILLYNILPPGFSSELLQKVCTSSYSGFLLRLLAQGATAGFMANGFRLLSAQQSFVGLLHLLVPLVNACQACTVQPPPGREAQTHQVHSTVAGWLEGSLQSPLPITVTRSSGGFYQHECLMVQICFLVIAVYLIPLFLALRFEENSRRSFLTRNGQKMLTPSRAWKLVHGLAMLVLGAKVVWTLLGAITPWI